MVAYYNEIDPYCAEWLRNLIAMGEIAPGIVDERSIEDVTADDLKGFTQCHFFAGIGVWSLALRRAGWPDNRPIWTGSCPCQPFSASGKQSGFADERHMWPSWEWLIRECRPSAIVGEQVASKAAEPWCDLVQADLEALDYAFGCIPFPSASIGAPHIRDRAYWVGHTNNAGLEGYAGDVSTEGREESGRSASKAGLSGRVANTSGAGPLPGTYGSVHSSKKGSRARNGEFERPRTVSRMADDQHEQRPLASSSAHEEARREQKPAAVTGLCSDSRPGPTNGFWADADWLFCRDGKWRAVEPGSSPLVDGATSRVGRLRAYGNAINAEAATVFIESVMDITALTYN